jgi:hypothetical protein
MQCTADFHDAVANTYLPEAAGVVDDAAALDATVDMLDAHAAARDAPLGGLLSARQRPAPRLLDRHDALHWGERERQEAQILEQATTRG